MKTVAVPEFRMEASDALYRLEFLRRKEWRLEEVSRWFGIILTGEGHRILQQFLMWDRKDYQAAFEQPETINRCNFEQFLQTRQWISSRGAALAWAVTDESFAAIIREASNRNIILPTEAEGVFPGVYSSEFISNFYKRFPTLRSKIFSTQTAYFDRFHEQIAKDLAVDLQPQMCLTAKVLGQRVHATTLDTITEEPMSQVFSVFIKTTKPLQLAPDACSMLTYVRFEDIIKPAILGYVAALTKGQFELLESYVQGR